MRCWRFVLVLGAALFASAGCQPSTRSDALIAQEIHDALGGEPALQGDTIIVRAVDGHVTLNGTVSSPDERDSAERIANDVSGVKDVENALEVAAAPGQTTPPVGSPPPSPAPDAQP